ncbi:MAG: AcrR family transcriptional regulator [Candidatus Azotimanducaceae bacterium]|jgi:AcrR family transcriptional regulator
MPAISKREQIVDEALKLFYQYGFNSTGVDKIITVAGVSKKTLYNHFKSKDELILATLRLRDERFRNNLMRETERLASTPKKRLLAIFDVVDNWLHEKTFSGCMFINAAAEFSDPQSPTRVQCADHKRLQREYIQKIAIEAGAKNSTELASELNLLIEGAIVNAYVERDFDAAIRAKKIASSLLNEAF